MVALVVVWVQQVLQLVLRAAVVAEKLLVALAHILLGTVLELDTGALANVNI
jgi:hypothetical protein